MQLVMGAARHHIEGIVKTRLDLPGQNPYWLSRLETSHKIILSVKSDGVIHELCEMLTQAVHLLAHDCF